MSTQCVGEEKMPDSILAIAHPNLKPVEILKSAKFTDITLMCGASSIRAHKVVLVACSSFFEEFFQRNQGVIVIPVERKASFLKVRQLFGVAMQGENIAAVSMGFEKSFGNEYNESNFDQVTAQNDGSGRISNGPEIIHVQFKKNRQGTDRRHQNRKRMEAKGIAS